MPDFFDELTELLLILHLGKFKFMVVGHFNIHMNKPEHINIIKINELLGLFDLKQHVAGQTHTSGSMLDLNIAPHNLQILMF